jgi:septum formation protein
LNHEETRTGARQRAPVSSAEAHLAVYESRMPMSRLILASGSPRRQSLLREAGYEFDTHPAEIDEDDYPPGLAPAGIAEHLALAKAEAVAGLYPQDVTLGADTVVALGSRLLGKPIDADDARRMLGLLSGTTHYVTTCVAIVRPAAGLRRSVAVTSTVQMRRLTPAEIDAYVASRQWKGKAGGYGIQDRDPFVTNMAGSLTNIVGLPMEATADLLSAAGISPTKTTMH